jgi:hypothetical protein
VDIDVDDSKVQYSTGAVNNHFSENDDNHHHEGRRLLTVAGMATAI